MPFQTWDFLSRIDGRADTAAQRVIVVPTSTKPQIDSQCGSWPGGELAEGFEGISPEEVKIMMELMRDLISSTTKRKEEFPLQPVRLQLRTLLIQADVAESCFDRLGAVECIVKAVKCRRQALSLTPEGQVTMPLRLATLGSTLLKKFIRLGDFADINQAIQCLAQAIQLTPEQHPILPALLNNLGSSYQSRFERFGEPADMIKAMEYLTLAVQLTPDDHPDKPSRFNNLGLSYMRRFEHLDDLADVAKAIEWQNQAVQLTPDGHPDKPGWLNNLGLSYISRFDRLGELSDMAKAIQCHTQAVQLTPDSYPHKPGMLDNLGTSYMRRFERLGEPEDLAKAIECSTQAVQLTPDGHPDKPTILSGLGNSYTCRFERYDELADVVKAIECHTQAVQLTPDGHPDRSSRLESLGNSYMCRFQHLDELADVDQALECLNHAVRLTPDDHPGRPGRLESLGNSYMFRFQRLDKLADMDQAVEYLNQAVQLTPDDHPRKSSRLNNLGTAYMHRFQRLGELADVDQGVECLSQAVQLIPDGHTDKPSGLNNIGNSYMRRFHRLGEFADMTKAINHQTRAVQLTPDGHPDKPSWLNNIGLSYIRRFELSGKLADMAKAIECHTQAVLLTPDGHSHKPGVLNNLGTSYMRRFEHLGELADAAKAIECNTQSVQLTPDGHPDKPSGLNNLGLSYMCRFKRLSELADVAKTIECHTQAVQLTPDGHSDKPSLLYNLGNAYLSRFKHLGELADVTHAQSSFQQGAQLVLTSPESQLNCARNWAKASSLLGLSPQGAYELCIELLPRLIWIGTTINHRYSLLTKVNDLATEAASWAISVKSYNLAIEWLEEGRSIVWNQILQLRTPVDQLSIVDPELAQHLKDIARQLENAGSSQAIQDPLINRESDLETAAQHHRRLAAEWERCLEQARDIPGFHNFMRPRKAEELKLAATDGPVILINTHFTRCDALIVFPQCDDVAHIPLDHLSLEKVVATVDQLRTIIGHRGHQAGGARGLTYALEPDEPRAPILATLWSDVVKPVLDMLGCSRKLPVEELPHVTWCATGALASVPLHATGPDDGSSLSTFDLIVSSYTPTLGALLPSSIPAPTPDVGLLAVGQQNTPGLSPLPYTVLELAEIERHTGGTPFIRHDGDSATVEAVLKAMDECSWVHLACHAIQHPINPAHSAFHLRDGELTLETITRRQFKDKGLAFLSACQTAKGDGKLPDEAIHLAAGMLMAGYPSVIATMWSIADIDGPEVAGRVYEELLKDGKMDHKGAARALHKAVAELRAKIGVDKFERWVPFIHIGV